MTIEEAVFQKYRPIPERLRDFGFRAEKGMLIYQAPLLDGAFLATITVGKEKMVDGHVVDPQTGGVNTHLCVWNRIRVPLRHL